MPRRRNHALMLGALGVLGCDGQPTTGPITVFPVQGQITFQGRPVSGVLVVLHPSGSDQLTPHSGPNPVTPLVPTGTTDADGTFRMHSYVGDDGAPAGVYRVAVIQPQLSERRNIMAKRSVVPLDTIPAKFADPNQSGLTATVKPAANVLPPFEL